MFVLPGGPCVTCLDELDSGEIARWAKPSDQQNLDRQHGYGTATTNPSVVHLNGLAVNAALAELAAWLSGARPPARWLDIDLLGNPNNLAIRSGHGRSQSEAADASIVARCHNHLDHDSGRTRSTVPRVGRHMALPGHRAGIAAAEGFLVSGDGQ